MIETYTLDSGRTLYRVRAFVKSSKNPEIRVTRQSGGIATQAEAEREEIKLRKECSREVAEREARGILFSGLLEEWYEHETKMRVLTGKKSQGTLDDSLACLKKWFGDYFRRSATDLNPYVVVGVFEQMKAKGLGFGHRKRMKQDLKRIFDLGIQMGLLPTVTRSPTYEVVLNRAEEKMPEILTHGQIQKLIDKAYEEGHEWRRIWAAALLTGMRSGELFALTWKDVDWERMVISVTKSYNCRLKIFKSTKSGTWRQIPINEALASVLKEQLEETGSAEHVFPRSWEWSHGMQAAVLRRFCFAHQLPSVRFHALRACFATQMLNRGVDTAKVMKIAGWKELKTMQHYVRLAGVEIQGGTQVLNFNVGDKPRTSNPELSLVPSLSTGTF